MVGRGPPCKSGYRFSPLTSVAVFQPIKTRFYQKQSRQPQITGKTQEKTESGNYYQNKQ